RREQDGAIITQFDYPTCERLGLIKMDFLGLRNLTILDDALVNITNNRQQKIVLEDLTLDDPATFSLLSRGDTLGVFQLDGRAMGKKKKAELDKQFEAFSAGMQERGYSANAVQTLWDILLPFSDYAFNKAHSAAYGLVSYWTAYLKANYPAEYMAAVLTSVKD